MSKENRLKGSGASVRESEDKSSTGGCMRNQEHNGKTDPKDNDKSKYETEECLVEKWLAHS